MKEQQPQPNIQKGSIVYIHQEKSVTAKVLKIQTEGEKEFALCECLETVGHCVKGEIYECPVEKLKRLNVFFYCGSCGTKKHIEYMGFEGIELAKDVWENSPMNEDERKEFFYVRKCYDCSTNKFYHSEAMKNVEYLEDLPF